MAAGYLGLFLMVASFLAIGVAMSSLFSNQIAAFFATFGVLLVLWLIGYPAQVMGALGGAGILQYLDIQDHYFNSFYTGVIELKDVIYYLSVICLALFLGSVSIETRRWR
jgi:ABC-2 type transport system permease protein